MHAQNLIAGKAARDIHASKVKAVLGFGYRTHLLTSRVVMRLLGTSQPNAAVLLKKLDAQGLVHSVNIKYSSSAPRGQGYLLTPRGVAIAIKDYSGPLHDYDHRAESVRLDQSEHDLQLAEFAAVWVSHGGGLEQTDFMLRQAKAASQKKLPDLVLASGNERIAIEYERLPKKPREVDQMLLASARSNDLKTIWFCSVLHSKEVIDRVIANQEINHWKLNASNKWVTDGESWLSFTWRKKQLVLHSDPDKALGLAPDKWLNMLASAEADEYRRSKERWHAKGWRWGPLVITNNGPAFSLAVDNNEYEIQLSVCFRDPDRWFVSARGESPESGYDLGVSATRPTRLDALPGLALVERAIRKVYEVDFEFA